MIEFCLPFTELKHIVEGMADDETQLHIEYPVNDNFLQIKIPEDSRGAEERVIQETIVRLNTYEA